MRSQPDTRNQPHAAQVHSQAVATTVAVSHQAITPELRHWIIEQAQAQFPLPVILQSMCDAGWNEDVAMRALEQTLQENMKTAVAVAPLSCPGHQAVPSTASASASVASTATKTAAARDSTSPHLPEPALQGAPSCLHAGDREVKVLLTLAHPRIVVLGNLLSDEECEALIAAAAPRMARSLTVATQSGGEEINDDRTSDGMFFQRAETPLLQRIEERIARLLHWPVENGEGLQVLHYRPGAEYKPHYDYFDPAEPGTATIVRRGGQRVGTLVMYLNTPEQGGGTTFPDVQLAVAPQRGNAVFFSYDQPHPSTRSLHGGAPVLAGDKWIATKWLREREFK